MPTTIVGLPVVDGQGVIASILVAEIDGRNLWRSIDTIQLGRTGRVFVASAEGMVVMVVIRQLDAVARSTAPATADVRCRRCRTHCCMM